MRDLRELLADAVEETTGRPVERALVRHDATRMSDLGVTSLHLFRVISGVERRLGVTLTEADVDAAASGTVGGFVAALSPYADPGA